jgi:uncharacterized BrkB/YihY/UPF0761 family membrane protein
VGTLVGRLVLGSILGTFNAMIFAIALATLIDVRAQKVLRWYQPKRYCPYQAWCYPWLPAIYLVTNGVIAIQKNLFIEYYGNIKAKNCHYHLQCA